MHTFILYFRPSFASATLVLLFSHLSACSAKETFHVYDSLVQVIADPTRFEGKTIYMYGIFSYRDEETVALYLNLYDAKFRITKNALYCTSFVGDKFTDKYLQGLNNKCVVIGGDLLSSMGPYKLYVASLDNITLLASIESEHGKEEEGVTH